MTVKGLFVFIFGSFLEPSLLKVSCQISSLGISKAFDAFLRVENCIRNRKYCWLYSTIK